MPKDKEKTNVEEKGILLSPLKWWISATILWSILIIPITVAVFYMLYLAPRLFQLPNEFSPLFGIGVGLALSCIVGFLYSRAGMKRVGQID